MGVPKRGGAKTSSAAKRARTVDPVTSKISELVAYLNDRDACDVPSPDACRDMMEQAVPFALGNGAAKGERHAYQDNVITMISQILNTSVCTWQSKVDEAQSGVNSAEVDKKAAVSEKDCVADRCKAQQTSVEEAKEKVQAAYTGLTEAKSALILSAQAVDNHSEVVAEKECGKTKFAQVLSECFLPLQAGDIKGQSDKSKAAKQISEVVKKLSVDESLKCALPSALQKESSERGTFDTKVIQQVNDKLNEYITQLESDLSRGDDVKKEKELAKVQAEASLEAAQNSQKSSVDELQSAQEMLKALEANSKEADKAILAKEKAIKAAIKKQVIEQAGLDRAKEAVELFGLLRDRDLGMPAVEADDIVVEPVGN